MDLVNAAIAIFLPGLRGVRRLITHFVMRRNWAGFASRMWACLRELNLWVPSYDLQIECRIFLFLTVYTKLCTLIYAWNFFLNWLWEFNIRDFWQVKIFLALVLIRSFRFFWKFAAQFGFQIFLENVFMFADNFYFLVDRLSLFKNASSSRLSQIDWPIGVTTLYFMVSWPRNSKIVAAFWIP